MRTLPRTYSIETHRYFPKLRFFFFSIWWNRDQSRIVLYFAYSSKEQIYLFEKVVNSLYETAHMNNFFKVERHWNNYYQIRRFWPLTRYVVLKGVLAFFFKGRFQWNCDKKSVVRRFCGFKNWNSRWFHWNLGFRLWCRGDRRPRLNRIPLDSMNTAQYFRFQWIPPWVSIFANTKKVKSTGFLSKFH